MIFPIQNAYNNFKKEDEINNEFSQVNQIKQQNTLFFNTPVTQRNAEILDISNNPLNQNINPHYQDLTNTSNIIDGVSTNKKSQFSSTEQQAQKILNKSAVIQQDEIVKSEEKKEKNAINEENKNNTPLPTTNFSYGLKDIRIIKKLGKGKHSEVFLSLDVKTGFLFALKKLSKKELVNGYMSDQFASEIKIQNACSHPNIIQLYGFFDDEEYFYLIMEYAPGGELYKFQRQQPDRCLSEESAAFYLMQVADALFYIHKKKIIHRDIKTENVLICNNLVKIADFGYSRYCDDKEGRKTYCGTLDYMSPEIVKGEKYNKQVDVWAFGVMAYELMQGVTPFYERTRKGTLEKIQAGQFKFVKEISQEAQSFITGLLNISMANRSSIKQQLKHPWMVKYVQQFDKQMKQEMNEEINNVILYNKN